MKRLDDSGSRITASEKRVADFVKDYERLLERTLGRVLKQVEVGSQSALETAAALGSLHEKLLQAGLGAELDRINALYAAELNDVREQLSRWLKKGRFVYSGADLKLATTLIDFDTSLIENYTRTAEDNLRSAIMKRVVTGERPEIDPLLATYIPGLAAKVETELRTGTVAFYQTITNKKADEYGLELWSYEGPLDEVTRDFCKGILEGVPVFTTEERAALVNPDSDLPVDVYRGGYNCRHTWEAITLERAREVYGYDG